MFRVKDEATLSDAPVVFLQHGLMCSADSFAVNGNQSTAFILAKQGYDVWLGNSRGSKYSREHLYWDPNEDEEYWNFSWEQMGVYDLPAAIDYVRDQTK
jgi:lysosomal acid lipase/cholesteryl ester hydrolase